MLHLDFKNTEFLQDATHNHYAVHVTAREMVACKHSDSTTNKCVAKEPRIWCKITSLQSVSGNILITCHQLGVDIIFAQLLVLTSHKKVLSKKCVP